jgi:hypothetical protein
MKHAADVCTALRVLLAPVLAWQLALPRSRAGWLPLVVYLLAAATDYVDASSRATDPRRARAGSSITDLPTRCCCSLRSSCSRSAAAVRAAARRRDRLHALCRRRMAPRRSLGTSGDRESFGRGRRSAPVWHRGGGGGGRAHSSASRRLPPRLLAAVNTMAALSLVQLLTSARGSLVAKGKPSIAFITMKVTCGQLNASRFASGA